MYLKTAAFYDAIYRFLDYAGACEKLEAIIARENPSARTLLDVGCGTGRHLELLGKTYQAEGLDLDAGLLAVARGRLGDMPLHQGDMVDFSLPRRFDVIVCLFSAISYVRTVDRMYAAIANMARHLNPGGVLIVEPWFTPERLWTGHITANFVNDPDLKIAWMYTTTLVDRISVLDITYMVGTPATGVETFKEQHDKGVFTDAEYRDAFEVNGMSVSHDPVGLFSRGLYIGTKSRDGTEASAAASANSFTRSQP